MAFFRKWKTHYKHKKFTSDDTAIDGEIFDKEQRSPIKEIQNIEDMKLYAPEDDIDGDDNNKTLFESYDIKYLGCTPIETRRSEKVTSEAIKTVIANAKAGGRKSKTHKRVKVIISQSGIDVLDHHTQDTMFRYSIYKVSYCSVDASHDHTFSFVASEQDPLTDKEKLSCHVFDCPKRKIAHEITLMVARCFENAYQQWREALIKQKNYNEENGQKTTISAINNNNNGAVESNLMNHHHLHNHNHMREHNQEQKNYEKPTTESNAKENLLIDLAVNDNNNVDAQKYLQNAWVDFEDDGRDSFHIMAS